MRLEEQRKTWVQVRVDCVNLKIIWARDNAFHKTRDHNTYLQCEDGFVLWRATKSTLYMFLNLLTKNVENMVANNNIKEQIKSRYIKHQENGAEFDRPHNTEAGQDILEQALEWIRLEGAEALRRRFERLGRQIGGDAGNRLR